MYVQVVGVFVVVGEFCKEIKYNCNQSHYLR